MSLLYDNPGFFTEKDQFIDFEPVIRPMMFFDPVTRTFPQYFENNTIRVTHRDPLEIIEDVPPDNADAIYTVPAGEYKQIKQIYCDLEATGVAARAFTLGIVKNIGVVGLVDAMVTGAIALTDGQDGSFFMGPGGPTWLNDNGVITDEDTNIVGIILGPADTITGTWTNKIAADRCRLQVIATDVPNMTVL